MLTQNVMSRFIKVLIVLMSRRVFFLPGFNVLVLVKRGKCRFSKALNLFMFMQPFFDEQTVTQT